MAARSGMSNLLSRLRRMVDDSGSVVWTDDDHLQDVLDGHRVDVHEETLSVHPQAMAGSTVYHVYDSAWGNFEEAASGTSAWRVYDSDGTAQSTATYTADYIRGRLHFTADQEGSARYLIGRSYDLDGAAADLWRERASLVHSYYDFDADGQKMSRSQWFEHCWRMAERYERRGRSYDVRLKRSDWA